MTSTKSAQTDHDNQTRRPDIDRRYGKIGISAVAAAMRFQGETRNTDSYRFDDAQRD